MKRAPLIVATFLSFSLLLSVPSAEAGGGRSSIQNVGVRSLDKVFREARDVDLRITSAQQERKSARQNVTSVMGLDPKTSFPAALQELQSRASNKLKVTTRGGTPQITASDAVPSVVQNSVDAANSATASYKQLLSDLVNLPTECRQLVQQTRALKVADLKAELAIRSISDISKRITQVKTFRTNVQAIGDMPGKAERLLKGLRTDVEAVTKIFPAR